MALSACERVIHWRSERLLKQGRDPGVFESMPIPVSSSLWCHHSRAAGTRITTSSTGAATTRGWEFALSKNKSVSLKGYLCQLWAFYFPAARQTKHRHQLVVDRTSAQIIFEEMVTENYLYVHSPQKDSSFDGHEPDSISFRRQPWFWIARISYRRMHRQLP